MSKPIRIERGDVSDAGAFARLHSACFADAWPEDAFAALLSRDGVIALAARRDGHVSDGFILVQVAADEAEVLTLCVSPEARGRGVGEALLGAACEAARARNAVQMFLEVGEANAPALKLYQRAGFEAVGRRSAYYQRGAKSDDALVMRKALNQS